MAHRALEELQQHSAALRRLARDLVGASRADDVLQDAALEVLHSPPHDGGPLFGWLRTVVRRIAGRQRRTDAVRRRHEGAAAGERRFAERGAEAVDTLRVLTGWLTSLPEPYRSTLLARYLRERTPAEIAAETGVPVRTVKTRLQRGLQLLRQRADADRGDWRGALGAAFGVELTTGILMTSTATKMMVATGALLAAGLAVWQLTRSSDIGAPVQPSASQPVVAVASASADAEPGSSPTGRSDVTPEQPPAPPPAVKRAAADELVVRVVDAESGEPVVAYAMREHVSPTVNMFAKESTIWYPGEHRDGRLVLPAALFERRVFVIEDEGSRYLPSTWFGGSHAICRDGERTIEVRMPRPLDVTVRVVHERTGEPVPGTEVELLRPWIVPHEITTRTRPQPSEHFRAQIDDNAMTLNFVGGRALLLCGGHTDNEGCVRLRVPPREPLVLRLLGPGHRPVVRSPWSVAIAPATDIVETVAAGAAVQVRVIPAADLDALRVEKLDVDPARAAWYRMGVRLRHVQSGAHRPEDGGLYSGPIPFEDDGTCRVDGLAPGDWEVQVCYPWRTGNQQPLSSDTGMVQMPLPVVKALGDLELRVIDVDVSGWGCGRLDASATRDGGPMASGVLIVNVVGAVGPPQPTLASFGHLVADENARVVATLPPARYFARWADKGELVPLGAFTIRAGETSRIDFVADVVRVRVRIVEDDGATPCAGIVTLIDHGWPIHVETDASGRATFQAVMRGDAVQAEFGRPTGATPFGTPAYGARIPLGTIRANGGVEEVVLRLPAR